MIQNDQQLELAQHVVRRIQQVLAAARAVHSPAEYARMAEPILLELQQREQEMLEYLSHVETKTPCLRRHPRADSTPRAGNRNLSPTIVRVVSFACG